MPNGHLIAATVMTLGVCQGRSSIASFFAARRYAKHGICRRRVSVCLSHSSIVSKRLNVGSRKYCRTIAPGL